MALKWNVSTLDDLAPETAALYVPDAERGGYRLDVTEPDAIRKALHVERDARATAERIAKAAEASLATHDADRAAAREAKRERDLAVAREAALRGTLLEARVTDAARTAGLHAAAIPDALRAARELFAVADDGNAVPKSGSPRSPTGSRSRRTPRRTGSRRRAAVWVRRTAARRATRAAPSRALVSIRCRPRRSRRSYATASR